MKMNYRCHTSRHLRSDRGFTLVEVVLVLMISAILVTVALKSGLSISDAAKVEETKQEMEALEFAIIGNPALQNSGARSDFGYVGDVGAMPPNLGALATNPGGYATWRGPYVKARFTQVSDDFTRDAWGTTYGYTGGVAITSTGSGSNVVRTFANSTDNLLRNTITGNVLDFDGTPPGATYRDSITIILTVPNGAGGMSSLTATPNASGYFAFDSIPIGNQTLRAINGPSGDTIGTYITVTPASTAYSELRFAQNVWGAGGLTMVAGSDSVSGSPPCTDVAFWIVNNTGGPSTITTISVSWPSPTAYYEQITFGGTTVFNLGGSPRGVSGVTYTLSSPYTINAGQSVKIGVLDFRSNNNAGGGSPVQMSNNTLSVVLSDGSTFTEVLPSCP